MRTTIAAIATPPGQGALGIVRLSGSGALGVAGAFLRPAPAEPRRAVFARAYSGDELLDQVVAVWYPAQSSPTGEDLVELTAHGSPAVLRRLLDEALACGAAPAAAGEFTRRAFLNGRLDLAQAEAVCSLIAADTDAGRRAALAQLEGGLSARVAELRAPAFDLLVRVEALLDHPDEDLAAAEPAATVAALSQSAARAEALAATYQEGRGRLEAPRVCLVGRPNAGKSSLLNALLGRDRAIVRPEPGTTRDTLEEPCALAGVPAVLVDTAGLDSGAGDEDPAEAEGRRRAVSALEQSDVAVLVVDGSRPEDSEDGGLRARVLAAGRPVVSVLSKADLPARRAPEGALSVSAREGQGLLELARAVAGTLARRSEPREPLVVGARHHRALTVFAAELRAAAAEAGPGREDRLAARLRAGLRALDEITGARADAELLDAVFSRFCLGK